MRTLSAPSTLLASAAGFRLTYVLLSCIVIPPARLRPARSQGSLPCHRLRRIERGSWLRFREISRGRMHRASGISPGERMSDRVERSCGVDCSQRSRDATASRAGPSPQEAGCSPGNSGSRRRPAAPAPPAHVCAQGRMLSAARGRPRAGRGGSYPRALSHPAHVCAGAGGARRSPARTASRSVRSTCTCLRGGRMFSFARGELLAKVGFDRVPRRPLHLHMSAPGGRSPPDRGGCPLVRVGVEAPQLWQGRRAWRRPCARSRRPDPRALGAVGAPGAVGGILRPPSRREPSLPVATAPSCGSLPSPPR